MMSAVPWVSICNELLCRSRITTDRQCGNGTYFALNNRSWIQYGFNMRWREKLFVLPWLWTQYEAVEQIECPFSQLLVAAKLNNVDLLFTLTIFFEIKFAYQMHIARNLPFQIEDVRCFFGKTNLFRQFAKTSTVSRIKKNARMRKQFKLEISHPKVVDA